MKTNAGEMIEFHTGGFRALLAAVVNRALDDIKGAGPRCHRIETDRAMAFILGDVCEAYCLELGIDHGLVREKAAAFYRRVLEKEKPRKPCKALKRVHTRQNPIKRNIATGR